MPQIDQKTNRLELIRADGSYGGSFKDLVEGVYKWRVETGKRPPDQKGFIPQKGRWQVERAFAWLNNFRRLAKDSEKTFISSESFLRIAAMGVILGRLT